MDKRHFIFDIDGTLINTEKAIIKGRNCLSRPTLTVFYDRYHTRIGVRL